MLCHRVDLPIKGNPEQIEILVICCMHIGHRACDYPRLKRFFKWLMEGENRFAMDLGDDMENAVPGDEVHNSMMWDSDMHPEDQYRKVAEMWLPVVEKNKLIITHNSNHFWRSQAKTGMNIPKQLNAFLQQDNKTEPSHDHLPVWGDWQHLTQLQVKKQSYMVHSWHGSGNGCTPESALRKCRSQAEHHTADIYLMGHAHNKVVWCDNRMEFSAHGMQAREKQRAFGVTGGFLGWHGTYAERAGLRPNRRGPIVLRLGVKEWDVKLSL